MQFIQLVCSIAMCVSCALAVPAPWMGGTEDTNDSTKTSSVGSGVNVFYTTPSGKPFSTPFVQIPNDGEGIIWNNTDINMYKYDMELFQDTVEILLQDKLNGENFVFPVQGIKTSGFGWRNLFGHRFHTGVDLDLNNGDPVMAAMDGVVRLTKSDRGYGNFVVIAHKNGLETLYGHLSAIDVYEGMEIKAGQVIGKGGSTGWSTGPHLHFELRVFGTPIDLEKVIDFKNKTIKHESFFVEASWFTYRTSKDAHYHIASAGESLHTIASLYGKDVEDVAELNNLSPDASIKPGRKVRYQ